MASLTFLRFGHDSLVYVFQSEYLAVLPVAAVVVVDGVHQGLGCLLSDRILALVSMTGSCG